ALAAEKGVELMFDYEEIDRNLIGDSCRLRQILVNLLGNAVKFTAQGSVSLRVHMSAHKGDMVLARFEVEDTGIGIMKEYLQRIFEKFAQGGTAIASDFGGIGLGLSITKKLVEAMQGKIGVTSSYGHGSLFWCEIPFRLATTEEDSVLETV